MKKHILLFALAAVTTGCAQQTFVMSDEENALTNEKSHHFFVNGIGQRRQINAAEVCGGAEKVSKVEVQETFFNGVLATVTFGFYTPRDARVYCKA